jgi:DNA-binding NarL/FixJ family response regulator
MRRRFTRVQQGARIAIVPWRRPPWPRELSVAILTRDEERQTWMRRAFGDHAPCPALAAPSLHWEFVVDAGPDAVVIDCCEGLDAAATTAMLASLPGHPAVVVVGAVDDPDEAIATLAAGAGALLPGDAPAADVPEAVASVLRGEAVTPPSVAREVVRRLREYHDDAD